MANPAAYYCRLHYKAVPDAGNFPSVLRHCWLGDRKGIRPVKKLLVGLLVMMMADDLTGALHDFTDTSIILCFNKYRLTQDHLENGR